MGFQEIDRTKFAVVGGEGAHLGELSRIEGVRAPAGFCVTTPLFVAIKGLVTEVGGLMTMAR